MTHSATMLANIFRTLRSYIAPFYPVDAEEQARRQRCLLGEAPHKAGDTNSADGKCEH